jgi:plasmid stabilization system protein ParE
MADYKVFWTITAIYDLEEIYDFLSAKSVEVAEKQIDNILKREEQLKYQPTSGPVQDLQSIKEEYRYLIEGNYKIIYHIQKNIIYIDTVFDTRQDPEKLNP